MFDKIKEILISELQVDEELITMDAALSSDLGVNSLELAELVLVVEDKLNIEIDEDDLHTFVTVGDVVNYLENLGK